MAPHLQAGIRGLAVDAPQSISRFAKRIYIPLTPTSPAGLVEANTVDPWIKSGQYGLAWTYFALAIMACVFFVRMWHFWQDKIRQAIYKQQVEDYYRKVYNIDTDFA